MAGKGQPKTGGGSRKGVPNKATKELKDMILGALDQVGGQQYLVDQAIENPTAFMSLVSKVLPKDINANTTGEMKVTILTGLPLNTNE